jgi:hypothetical protein
LGPWVLIKESWYKGRFAAVICTGQPLEFSASKFRGK